MRKREPAKSPASHVLSPLPFSSPNLHRSCNSSKPYNFNLNLLRTTSDDKTLATSTCTTHKTITTISDLKSLASSRSDSMKRDLDLCHSGILKEIDASKSRLSKRYKIQLRACMQAMDEAEKEYKKISDRISEDIEGMKASHAEFITEAQTTASRVCKVSIPEIAASLEKSIEGLRSHYGIPSTQI